MAAKGEAHPDTAKVDAAYRDALKAAYQILSFPRDDLHIFCPDNIRFSNAGDKVEFRTYMLEELMNLIHFSNKQGKEKEYNEVIKALVQYMNNPTDANRQAYNDANAKYNRDED